MAGNLAAGFLAGTAACFATAFFAGAAFPATGFLAVAACLAGWAAFFATGAAFFTAGAAFFGAGLAGFLANAFFTGVFGAALLAGLTFFFTGFFAATCR